MTDIQYKQWIKGFAAVLLAEWQREIKSNAPQTDQDQERTTERTSDGHYITFTMGLNYSDRPGHRRLGITGDQQ